MIKKYNYSGNNIEKFIDNKISEDFNNKEIVDYSKHQVNVYTSKENINKLKDNYLKYHHYDIDITYKRILCKYSFYYVK